MKDPFEIVETPLLTEKSMDMSGAGKYTFRVALSSNKIEIAHAVEKIYHVKVAKVNTMRVRGKKRHIGRYPEGYRPNWKKAIVTLQPGQSITMFEGL